MKEVITMEKCVVLLLVTFWPLMSSAALTSPPDSAQLLMACGAGSTGAALFAWKVSRKKDKEEAVINVLIALVGGVSFGYFGTKGLAALPFEWAEFANGYPPLLGLFMSGSGTPFIEWTAGGGVVKLLRKEIGDNDV